MFNVPSSWSAKHVRGRDRWLRPRRKRFWILGLFVCKRFNRGKSRRKIGGCHLGKCNNSFSRSFEWISHLSIVWLARENARWFSVKFGARSHWADASVALEPALQLAKTPDPPPLSTVLIVAATGRNAQRRASKKRVSTPPRSKRLVVLSKTISAV